MSRRLVALGSILTTTIFLTATMPLSAQTPGGTTQKWVPARTADGQPDIQGTWNNIDSFFTPFERPTELQGKDNLSAAELKAVLEKLAEQRADSSNSAGGVGAGPVHWYEYKEKHVELAASLVVEPRDGRVPAMTPSAQERVKAIRGSADDSYEFMETGDRCISRGILGDMIPTNYNNGKMIFQSPGYVVILSEMIHDARIIPVDGRPHLSSTIGQWLGDSRGRWEGNTLVVETTNFNAKAPVRRVGIQTEKLRMIERFTAVDANTLTYEVKIEDPTVYTAPWTIAFPYKRDNDYKMFEYACHEGNYAIPHTLSGARAQEKAKASVTTSRK